MAFGDILKREPKPTTKFLADSFDDHFYFFLQWKPVKDVFFLRYFGAVTTGVCSVTAALINSKVRKAVKLRNHALFTSYLPIVMLPSMISMGSHLLFVLNPLLMRERNCPICLQVRSGFLLFGCGVVLPSLLAPINAFMTANRYYTYAIPNLMQAPLENLRLALKIFKPLGPMLTLYSTITFGSGMLLAYLEETNYHRVMLKLSEMEAQLMERKSAKRLKET